MLNHFFVSYEQMKVHRNEAKTQNERAVESGWRKIHMQEARGNATERRATGVYFVLPTAALQALPPILI